MKEKNFNRNEIINKAVTYIFENLDKKLSVDELAAYCGYSKYHLMRMFREVTGESMYRFIKRIRLERSAWRLKVEKGKSVTEIGQDYGYSSSNFASAFKNHLAYSPEDFRRHSLELVSDEREFQGLSAKDIEEHEKNITVEELPDYFVIYERIRGSYRDMGKEWERFAKKYRHLSAGDTLYIECTIDDPSITDEDKCLYELCQTISPEHPAVKNNVTGSDSSLLTRCFEGGKYAVYHFKGFPHLMPLIYQEVFSRWLSRTNNQLDERPVFDVYRATRDDGYMEIDICFPLK